MPTLTDEQGQLLAEKRRTTLPDYFDAEIGDTKAIPNDTQDALILLKAETKQKATTYLKAIEGATGSQQATDYNDLLDEFAKQQESNSAAAAKEMDAIMSKFNDFRSKLSSDMSEAGTIVESGMQPVLVAMTKSMGRIIEIEGHEFYHRKFDSILLAEYSKEASDNRKKELRSWVRVIASYP